MEIEKLRGRQDQYSGIIVEPTEIHGTEAYFEQVLTGRERDCITDSRVPANLEN
jgi:hypothetical protein